MIEVSQLIETKAGVEFNLELRTQSHETKDGLNYYQVRLVPHEETSPIISKTYLVPTFKTQLSHPNWHWSRLVLGWKEVSLLQRLDWAVAEGLAGFVLPMTPLFDSPELSFARQEEQKAIRLRLRSLSLTYDCSFSNQGRDGFYVINQGYQTAQEECGDFSMFEFALFAGMEDYVCSLRVPQHPRHTDVMRELQNHWNDTLIDLCGWILYFEPMISPTLDAFVVNCLNRVSIDVLLADYFGNETEVA